MANLYNGRASAPTTIRCDAVKPLKGIPCVIAGFSIRPKIYISPIGLASGHASNPNAKSAHRHRNQPCEYSGRKLIIRSASLHRVGLNTHVQYEHARAPSDQMYINLSHSMPS